ncbi:unnamed protein product [Schistosoma intercalatum]|nr:unnamed protein product [Schistosoma intercalatum]
MQDEGSVLHKVDKRSILSRWLNTTVIEPMIHDTQSPVKTGIYEVLIDAVYNGTDMGLMQIKMLSTPLLPMLSLLYRYHFVFDDSNFLPLGIFIKLGILMIYIFPDNRKLIVSRQKCYCTMNLSDWALCQRTNGKWSIYPMWYQTIVHNRFLSQVNEQVGPLIHRLTPKYIDLVKVANSKECELSLLKNLRRIINENKCAACQRARNASTTKITFPTNGNQQTLENPIDWLNNHVWFNLFSEPRNDNVIKMRFVNSDDITQKTFTDVREDDYKQINAKIKEIRQKNFVRQYMYTK